ncbi:MAG: AAA family ATPase [Candidatus Colwellbacteria bacterium]|nr:AAA family ATPase [Candidatus Colwellbacteria bacterium]
MNKLVILRGPSGSGKSSVAKELREGSKNKVAIIDQDYLRRIVLKEKDLPNSINPKLILRVSQFALDNGYNVIVEGILYSAHYGAMFDELLKYHPKENYVYYFDISLGETLKRHITRDKFSEFGEKEMRQWYVDKDLLGTRDESIISESLSKGQIVKRILRETGL